MIDTNYGEGVDPYEQEMLSHEFDGESIWRDKGRIVIIIIGSAAGLIIGWNLGELFL